VDRPTLLVVPPDTGAAPVAPAMAEHVAVAGTVIRTLDPVPGELVWREPPQPMYERVAMLAGCRG
jgi:hypothetical protein